MKVESCWLIIFLIELLLVMSLHVRIDSRGWKENLGRNKLSFWKKNSVVHQTGDDKKDLAELNRLKQSNGTFDNDIQSSIEEFDEPNQGSRQFIDGTCTCA